jgi:hypothetical protein
VGNSPANTNNALLHPSAHAEESARLENYPLGASREARRRMGHKTISMTCRYAHLAASHKLAAVERLVEQTGAAQETPSDTRSDTRAIQAQPAEQVLVN